MQLYLFKSIHIYSERERCITVWFVEKDKFYNSLEFIDDSKTKDINDLWLLDQFVYVFQFLCKKNNKITDFNTLDEASKIEFLSEIIPVAYKELDTDGMRRISGLPFYIFVMIIGVVQYNLSISFSSLKSKLLQSFTTHQFTFAFRESSRINESYLTVSINELWVIYIVLLTHAAIFI